MKWHPCFRERGSGRCARTHLLSPHRCRRGNPHAAEIITHAPNLMCSGRRSVHGTTAGAGYRDRCIGSRVLGWHVCEARRPPSPTCQPNAPWGLRGCMPSTSRRCGAGGRLRACEMMQRLPVSVGHFTKPDRTGDPGSTPSEQPRPGVPRVQSHAKEQIIHGRIYATSRARTPISYRIGLIEVQGRPEHDRMLDTTAAHVVNAASSFAFTPGHGRAGMIQRRWNRNREVCPAAFAWRPQEPPSCGGSLRGA